MVPPDRSLMTDTFKLQAVEPPPVDSYMIPDPDSDTPPKRPKTCAVDGCDNAVQLTPTGRQGKYCAEHGSKDRAPGESRRSNTGGRLPAWAKAAEVENALNLLFKFGGAAVQAVNVVDGKVIAEGGPAISRALVDLGRTDRKLRRYLEVMTAPGKYGPLTFAIAGVVVPILANHGLIPTFAITVPAPSGENPEGVN